jgi:Na+/H+ antiporter NhaD/arsenite permease-like protein
LLKVAFLVYLAITCYLSNIFNNQPTVAKFTNRMLLYFTFRDQLSIAPFI